MSVAVRPPVPASFLLELWEQVKDSAPSTRALALAEGVAGSDVADVAGLPIGRRDALLLDFRSARSGSDLDAVVDCPACAEVINFTLDARALTSVAAAPVRPVSVEGYVVEWRPLDSSDLLAAVACADRWEAEQLLVSRSVTNCSGPDGPCSPSELPDPVRDALSEALAAADPLTEVLVHLGCPGCGEIFVSDVDVVAFVWNDVRDGAQRILRDVDLLARTYGWTEPDVLALSDDRRALYVALASQVAP